MSVPKRKKSKARTRSRRAHKSLKRPQLRPCPRCGAKRLSHRICTQCGYYNEKVQIEIGE